MPSSENCARYARLPRLIAISSRGRFGGRRSGAEKYLREETFARYSYENTRGGALAPSNVATGRLKLSRLLSGIYVPRERV